MRRLDAFVDLVDRWGRTINLVSRADLPHLRARHLADSLRLVPFVPAATQRAIDLGSGAGFPGLVLAIATGCSFDLIEADQRKAAFLAEAAMRLDAPVRVITSRIEDAAIDRTALITARALAPLSRLLGFAYSRLVPYGACLFLKGRDAEAEIVAARQEWRFAHELVRDAPDADGAVLRVWDIQRRR